jgi:hypothetical protein
VGQHGIVIVSGVVTIDSEEADTLRRLDPFVRKLPKSAFKDGEPKGRLLDEAARERFASLLAELPGVLLCPAMLDLSSIVGQPEPPGLLSPRTAQEELDAAYRGPWDEMAAGTRVAPALSQQQVLRLTAWARSINRAIRDSIGWYANTDAANWNSLRFELDLVEQPASREVRAFRAMLPMMVSIWSHEEPVSIIRGLHTPDHPLIKNWGASGGVDPGRMFADNIHCSSSKTSKGIQLADMTADLVRKALVGIITSADLHNFGTLMTKTIGNSFYAPGLLRLGSFRSEDFERRYHGLADVIHAARRTWHRSHARNRVGRRPSGDERIKFRTSTFTSVVRG